MSRDSVLQDRFSRRASLKYAGGILAGAGSIAGISARVRGDRERQEFKRKIEAADKITRKRGPEARTKFLNNNGVETKMVRGLYRNPSPSYQEEKQKYIEKQKENSNDDDMGTQRVSCVDPTACNGDIDLSLSISSSRYDNYYDVSNTMRMRYYWNCGGGHCTWHWGGEAPADGISFAWQRDHWKLENRNDIRSSLHTGRHQWWQNGSWNHEGLIIKINDNKMCRDSGAGQGTQWTPYETCGVYLVFGDQWQSDDDVTSAYRHSWNQGQISFGISYPFGLSASYGGTSAKSKKIQTDRNGHTLRVTT